MQIPKYSQMIENAIPIHRRAKQYSITSVRQRRLSFTNYILKQAKSLDKKQFNMLGIQKNKQKDSQQIDNKNQNKIDKNSWLIYNDNNMMDKKSGKIQSIKKIQKNKWRINFKNVMTFLPIYTTLVDNQDQFVTFQKTFSTPYKQTKNNSQVQHKINQALSQRYSSKLSPIKKLAHSDKTPEQHTPKNTSTVNFFNVQKLLIKSYIQNNHLTMLVEGKKNNTSCTNYVKNHSNGKYCNKIKNDIRKSHQSCNGDIYGECQVGNANHTIDVNHDIQHQVIEVLTETNHAKTPTKIQIPSLKQISISKAIRPFLTPFDRYYYFDFIWKVAYSNQLRAQFMQNLPKKYKIYIGQGNNSMLIKTLFKRRQYWWNITEKIQQANFIWTQIKVSSVFQTQKKCLPPKYLQEDSQVQGGIIMKRNLQIKRNIKIFNKILLERWLQYIQNNKQTQQKLSQNFSKRNKNYKNYQLKNININQIDKIKIHNHLQRNYVLGNKKALFSTMKKYYEVTNDKVFNYLPLTFHIQNGIQDEQYYKFLKYYYKKDRQQKNTVQLKKKIHNIWIVKPGQFTNRGNGIIVCKNLQDIKNILRNKKKIDCFNQRTYIIQQYIDKPFLYCKRKFDIRHYMLITCVNGQIKGYWYQLGYIRTTSYQYSLKTNLNSVHLTNDAVQKQLPQYGKYEKGNKLSYQDFQKYLLKQYKGKYNFYNMIYPQMKKIAQDSMKACALLIDQERKGHNFQIFGFDFMIDSNFHLWLIQINTNPCLQLSCPVLMDIIPGMVQNAIKIGVDSILFPPYSFTQKRQRFSSNILQQNRFELLYDSNTDEQQIKKMYQKSQAVKLNYKQLQKDQDQIYQDDGIQLED